MSAPFRPRMRTSLYRRATGTARCCTYTSCAGARLRTRSWPRRSAWTKGAFQPRRNGCAAWACSRPPPRRASPPLRSCRNTPPRRSCAARTRTRPSAACSRRRSDCWVTRSPVRTRARSSAYTTTSACPWTSSWSSCTTAPTRRGSNTAPAACRGCGTSSERPMSGQTAK